MNPCEILYICGIPTYNQSISGNGIILNILNSLRSEYDIKCIGIGGWRNENAESFLNFTDNISEKSDEWINENIPDHKILFLAGDDLTNQQMLNLHKKHNNKTIMYMMTNWVYGSNGNLPSWQVPHPEIEGTFESDISKKRYDVYKKINLHILNASSYSESVQKKSFFHDLGSSIIPLPFSEIYTANPVKEKKDDDKIILWGSAHPKTRRKGLVEFTSILNILKNKYPECRDVKVHTAGPKPDFNSPFEVINKGLLNRHDMSLAYQDANVFALTTLADGGPMMAAESIKNKTPLVSFNTNISMDIVENGINGYTVNSNEEFADKLYQILFKNNYKIDFNYVTKFNGESSVISKYKTLFNSILHNV